MEWSLTGLPLPIILRPLSPFTDDDLLAFSSRNRPYRMERTKSGDITVMTPVGRDGGQRELRVASALMLWADADGRGEAKGPNAGWNLPDGSTLSPDACWTEKVRTEKFTREQTERYLPICPDFIIEIRSQSDAMRVLQSKMQVWMENGAQPAWLIDPYDRTVAIYRPGQEPEVLQEPEAVDGEAPVAGFRLPTTNLWARESPRA